MRKPIIDTTDGFSAYMVTRLTGCTYSQLDHWTRQGLVSASVSANAGKGNWRRYSFSDIRLLREIIALRKAGVSFAALRAANLRAIDEEVRGLAA